MTDAPEVIYLQWFGNVPYGESTWCEDQTDDDDVEYIKKEIADKQLAAKDARIAKLGELLTRLLREASITTVSPDLIDKIYKAVGYTNKESNQ
jgi:hypothetical protein